MLSMKEKDELIVRLLEEGKTNKEILKEAKVSCSRVTKIRKRLEGDDGEPTIRNQAYKMYLDGKKPIDVAIELKIDNTEAARYWSEYLQLTREYTLLQIRRELKGDSLPFVNLYGKMKKKHYRLDQVEKALNIVDKIEAQSLYLIGLEDDRRKCLQEINQLEIEIKRLNSDKSVAEYRIRRFRVSKIIFVY